MNIFLKSKLVSLTHEIDVTNDAGELLYKSTSRPISLEDKTVLEDVKAGKKLAKIHRKPISIHEVYYVEMADGTKFEFNTEIFKVVQPQIDITGLGWQIKGNLLQHDFDVLDETGAVVASSHKAWVSLHEAYEVDVADDTKLEKIVAVYVVLDHIMMAREQNAAAANNALHK